jgi:hypothetical protein
MNAIADPIRRICFHSSRSRFVVSVFVLGLVVRVALVVAVGDTHHPKMYEHGMIAHNLYVGNGFAMHWPYEPLDSTRIAVLQAPVAHEGAFIPPLSPYEIYAAYLLFGETPTAALALMLINAMLGAITLVLLYYTTLRLASDRAARIVSGFASVFLPAALVVTSFSGSAIYHLLAVAVLYLSLSVIQVGKVGTVLALSACAGLLTMARSEFLLLGAIMLPLAVLVSRSSTIRRHRLSYAVLGVVVFSAVVAPWTIRNYLLFDRFVPVVSHPWFEIWRGNNRIVADAKFLEPTCDWVNPREFPALVHRMDSIPYDRTFEPRVNDLFKSEATTFMLASPLTFVKLAFKKALFLITVDASDATARNPLYLLLMLPSIGAIIVGMVRMARVRLLRAELSIAVLFVVYHVGLTIMTYPLPRYQIYYVVALLPFAAFAVARQSTLEALQTRKEAGA